MWANLLEYIAFCVVLLYLIFLGYENEAEKSIITVQTKHERARGGGDRGGG